MKRGANRLWALGLVCLIITTLLGLLLRAEGARETLAEMRPTQEPATSGSPNYRLVQGIFASGSGGTRLQSPSYRQDVTVGEPALAAKVELSSDNYTLRPGFLAAFDQGNPIFLPLMLVAPPCDHHEPNNDPASATGPLVSGVLLQAKICDDPDDDYYYIDATVGGSAKMTLTLPTNLVNHAVFWLYRSTNVTPGAQLCGTGPVTTTTKTVTCPLPSSGRYIIHVYTDGTYDTNNPYSLKITYP